jgi:hypothetical protein
MLTPETSLSNDIWEMFCNDVTLKPLIHAAFLMLTDPIEVRSGRGFHWEQKPEQRVGRNSWAFHPLAWLGLLVTFSSYFIMRYPADLQIEVIFILPPCLVKSIKPLAVSPSSQFTQLSFPTMLQSGAPQLCLLVYESH